MLNRSSLLLLPLVFTVTGCDKGSPPPAKEATPSAAPAPTPAVAALSPAEEAKKVYKTRCVVCHGEAGGGDGPGAAAMDPKPKTFRDDAWQASVTDEAIAKIIVEGGAAVGKSAGMAANRDLAGKKEVVKELVAIVRGFKP